MEKQKDKNIPDMYTVDAIKFLPLVQVRERLRTAQERNIVLEDELMLANQEVRDSTHKPHPLTTPSLKLLYNHNTLYTCMYHPIKSYVIIIIIL